MTEMKNHHAESKALVDNLGTHLDDFRRSTTSQFEKCVQSWQLLDTRVTKLEEDQMSHVTQCTPQSTVNKQVSGRLSTLENYVTTIRGDLFRLEAIHRSSNAFDISQVLPPISL